MPTHQMSNVIRAVLSEPWLIQEEKLEEIAAFLELRASGLELTEAELSERFGGRERTQEGEGGPQIIEGGIQVIDVTGTLMPRANLMMRYSGGTSTMQLAKAIREAASNNDAKSVVLRIDSPGGAASYTPEVAEAIRELAQTKRVVSSATNMICSGAYWIGVAADESFASPSTTVGSIGVYSIIPNYKEAYEKSGIKFAVLRAGTLKASGNPYEELTSERLASLQKSVDDIYANFLEAVATYRKKSVMVVAKEFGQGSTFLAPEAQSRGMIDGVLTFEQVIARERDRSRLTKTVSVVVNERKGMNPKLKAALFARDLIESIDADDATCQAALRGYCAALGRGNVTEEEALKMITGSEAREIVKTTAAPLQTAKPDNISREQIATEERYRITEIKTRGELLGMASEDINAAIEDGSSVSEAVDKFTGELVKKNKPVNNIAPLDSSVDKFNAGASAAICARVAGVLFEGEGEQMDEETRTNLNKYGQSLKNRRVIDLIRGQLKSQNMRVTEDDNADAKLYLQTAQIFAAGGSRNSRGDHPDLLSSLTNKALTRGAILAEVSYPQWTSRIEDLPDFKPKHFVDVGIFRALDAIQEGEDFKELKFESAINNWIKADRYGDMVGLTVEMLVDDDLGGFARQLRSLTTAARLTIQRDILDLLYANPTMMDGNAFFSAAHANYIATGSGGAISATQLKTHRTKHRKASSYGTGNLPMGAPLRAVLVPAEMEDPALQTLAPVNTAAGIEEMATKQTDGNLNTFRGKVTPIVDAYCDAYSTLKWFSMTSRDLSSPLVYAYQRGFGADGEREDFYDPKKKTRFVSVEIRFGVALNDWRGIVMNDGN